MKMTLQDLLAPVTPERFFAEYYDRQPLHVPGGAAKFAAVLDWAGIDALLGMTHIWSEKSLRLVMDSVPGRPSSTAPRRRRGTARRCCSPSRARCRSGSRAARPS